MIDRDSPYVEKPDSEKPSMFLRKTEKGGMFFISPKRSTIYYLNMRHVKELIDGTILENGEKREFVCIHKDKFRGEDDKKRI